MSRKLWESYLHEQRMWMLHCGGDLDGYRKRYGDPDFLIPIDSTGQLGYFGEGATIIYQFDLQERLKIEKEVAKFTLTLADI